LRVKLKGKNADKVRRAGFFKSREEKAVCQKMVAIKTKGPTEGSSDGRYRAGRSFSGQGIGRGGVTTKKQGKGSSEKKGFMQVWVAGALGGAA